MINKQNYNKPKIKVAKFKSNDIMTGSGIEFTTGVPVTAPEVPYSTPTVPTHTHSAHPTHPTHPTHPHSDKIDNEVNC